jgi:hypothetical protein
MRSKIGKVIDWWCTGVLVAYLILLGLQLALRVDGGTIAMAGIMLGIPAALIFLAGKSLRFTLSPRI